MISSPPFHFQKWLTLPRTSSPELLEMGHGTLHDVAVNLDEMARINRWLGGFSALTTHLFPRLKRLALSETTPSAVIDVGVGDGSLLHHIGAWTYYQQMDIQLIGLDIEARHLRIAQHQTTPRTPIFYVQADAQHLPLVHNQPDYIISTLLLHHFDPDTLICLLSESYQHARHGIIMSDIVRGWLPLLGFRLLQPIFARHYLTRHDGALSIRRAYTPDELIELAKAAGLSHAQIYRHWPYRMTLVIDKDDH